MKNGEEAHRESIRGQIMRVNGQIQQAFALNEGQEIKLRP